MTNLNKEQARAINHFNGPCLVLAGPGSGKTFTLVNRIINMVDKGVRPSSLLVITFSKKAAIEMKSRYENTVKEKSNRNGGGSCSVSFGTFHAVFYNILRQHADFDKDSVLTDAMKIKYIEMATANITNTLEKDNKARYELRSKNKEYKMSLLKAISLHKIENTTHNLLNNPEFGAVFEEEDDENIFLKISHSYQKLCRDNKKLDFEDMLYMCRDILKNNSAVLEKYRSIYKYFLVDEFQDINEIQYEILMLLAGDERNIFAVGDDDQSIYGFRGSRPEFMKRFIEENSTIEVIDMFKNYRSAKCIIDSARNLITNNKTRIEKNQEAASELKDMGSVTINIFKNACDEADFITSQLTESKDLGSIAIIYRTNKCVHILSERLKLSGIKCISNTKNTSYYEIEWIQDIIAYLKIANGIGNNHIYRIINRPDRGFTRDSDIKTLLNTIEIIKDMSPYAAVMYIFKAIGYERYYYKMQQNYGVTREIAMSQLDDFLDIARGYKSTREWLIAIDELVDENDNNKNTINDNIDGISVHMLTAHASKGLEFDTVFVVGLQEGIFPHRKAMTEEQIEEERRLLYVAMTRAKRNLYVTGRGEEKYGKRVSTFIAEIGGIMQNNEV